ncbi:MAG TPA: hypothetical protein PLJ11_07360 [Methanomassiliicoccales archaeon]|nr:hypothetical protein [Methanomassiliicoccales archaeon]
MAAGMDTSINWTFNMVDNVSATTKQMADSQAQLAGNASAAKASIDSQNISFIAQTTAVMATYGGVRRLTSSLTELGLVSEGDAVKLQKLNATLGLVAGGFQLMKGATQIIKMLTQAEIGLAAVESFRAVLNNPAKIALVGAGLGLAAGVGAALLATSGGGGGGGTTVNQTITFEGAATQDQRSVARETYEAMGGF